MSRTKKDGRANEPGFLQLWLTIGVSALVGHLVGRWARPRLLPYLGVSSAATPTDEFSAAAAAETLTEDADFDIAGAARQIMPGIAVALAVRNILGARRTPLSVAAFLGSFALTVIANTKYDEQTRRIIKTVAPGGQFLA